MFAFREDLFTVVEMNPPCSESCEYRQMAALACDLIDLLNELAKDDMTVEELKEQIGDVHEQMEKLITDPVARNDRFTTLRTVYSLACLSPPGQATVSNDKSPRI